MILSLSNMFRGIGPQDPSVWNLGFDMLLELRDTGIHSVLEREHHLTIALK